MTSTRAPLRCGDLIIPSNLYEVLGLDPGPELTQRQIHKAYLKRAADVHPDKHPASIAASAAAAFDRVSLAYHTLSNAARRSAYDSQGGASSAAAAPTAGAIDTGDRWFAAMAEGIRCSEVLPLMRLLPDIEARFGFGPGSLTAVNGLSWPGIDHSCDGGDGCELVHLTPDLVPTVKDRALLCQAHKVVHQCGPRCSPTTQDCAACPLWASALGRQHREAVAAAWSVHTSLPTDPVHPMRPYWHNAAAGISVWLPPPPATPGDAEGQPLVPPAGPVTPHVCTAADCARCGFVQLEGCIWACRASSTVHVCTPSQCRWTTAREEPREGGRPARLVCWATKRPVADGASVDWGYASEDRPAGCAANTTTGVQRLLKFADTHGQTVTTLIERPAGTAVGEAVVQPAWHQHAIRDFDAVFGAQQDKAILFDARDRDAERDAVAQLEEVLDGGGGGSDRSDSGDDDGDFAGDCNTVGCNLLPWPSTSAPSAKRCRPSVASASEAAVRRSSKTSRLDRIKAGLATAAQRIRRDEFVDEVGGEGVELGDAGDICNAARVGMTLPRPGTASSWGHEDRDFGDTMDRTDAIAYQAHQEELAAAKPQFLKTADPRAPIEYHCSAIEWANRGAIGTPHPDDRRLRVFHGRAIIAMQPA